MTQVVGLMGNYRIKCLGNNEIFDDAYTLHHTDGALVSSVYSKGLNIDMKETGVWKYLDWLPVSKASKHNAGTVTYKSEGLASKLGLSNLWITYHGYWPERGGLCPTGAFKDMEAVPTIQRLRDHGCNGVICASAGNTARAFSHYCDLDNFPLIVVVADIHAHRIWRTNPSVNDCVKVVVVENGNYADAKIVAKEIASKLNGWQLEGGAHNIARRDGIGSLILDAWNEIGRMPDHYFQGVGGGPGPIGVNEMMQRLIDFGLDEGPLAKIHLSQNPEHCPIHKAWQDGRSTLQDSDFPEGDVEVYSDYLLSASPAYGVKGGVYDTLKSTKGETYVVERQDAIDAGKLFEQTEGIDIMTPAEVALGSLIQAIEEEKVNKDDCIVLNISGGGVKRLQKEKGTIVVEPWLKGPRESLADLVITNL